MWLSPEITIYKKSTNGEKSFFTVLSNCNTTHGSKSGQTGKNTKCRQLLTENGSACRDCNVLG